MTVGIAGAGRVAQAVGRHLRELGQPVTALASRSVERAREAVEFVGGDVRVVSWEELHCDRVLIAVADRAIVDVARRIPAGPIVLHTCGAYGADLLRGVRSGACGAAHPLQTFPTAEAGYWTLPGCAWAVNGEPAAVDWAKEIAGILGGWVLNVPEGARASYHAGAVLASNHLVALVGAAAGVLANAAQVREREALRALAPLARTALENVLERGAMEALTGPAERGDLATVRSHEAALPVGPVLDLYRAGTEEALDIVRRRELLRG